MKKLLLLTLVVLALVFALASCGEIPENATTMPTTTQPINPEPPIHTHNYDEWKTVKNPTCTENGEEVRYCSCGEKQSEVIPALGHKRAEAVEENRVEATCYAEGSYDNVVYCSECKAELERASYTLSKVEHTPAEAVEENRVNATHEKDGSYQIVVYCSVAECHAELERTTHTLDMLVHHPGNAVVENEVAATCTQNGSYDEVVYCLDDDCGHKELSRKTVSVPMVAHTPAEAVEENRVEATCITNGSYDEVVYCVNCGTQMSRTTKTIDATGHTESDWIVDVEPTTTTEGSKHTECTVCGEKIRTEVIEKTYSQGLEYTLNDDGQSYSVIGIGSCTDKDLVIPSIYNGLPVTNIDRVAFDFCNSLTSVVVPDSVLTIGDYAFWNCGLIKSVSIGKSVTSVGAYAFYSCVNLTDITIGDSVVSIGDAAFGYCRFSSIKITDKVTSIAENAFIGCSKLTSIAVDENNQSYKSMDGNLYSNDGKNLIQYSIAKQDDSFKIPNFVMNINDYAFHSCKSLSSIEIPSSVMYIGRYALIACTSLNSIIVDESNQFYKSIDENLYSKDGKKLIKYSIGKQDISFTVPDFVTSIGDSAFSYCESLTNIIIPDSITSIGGYVFNSCTSFTSITYNGTIEKWNAIAKDEKWDITTNNYFVYCTDGQIAKDGTVTYNHTHEWSEWVVVVEPTTEVAGLKERYCNCGEKESELIQSLKNPEESEVSQGLEYALNDKGQSYFVSGIGTCTDTDIVIPHTYEGLPVTGIRFNAFYDCTSLTSIVIPDSVTSIGGEAFCNCSSLTSVTIGNSVTSIDDNAFAFCTSLTIVLFDQNSKLTSIGNNAFWGCTSLESIAIPDSVASIGGAVFLYCTSLTIYCEAEGQPSGWDSKWNSSNRPVIWGYTGE